MKSHYRWIEQALHRIALDHDSVKRLCHDLERRFFLSDARSSAAASIEKRSAVLVCGLARSGTTVLLQALDETQQFASLTYRDMPFVLAPNLWARFSRGQSQHRQPVERAHGDGLMVHADSPESFEEVFWQLEQPYRVDEAGLHLPTVSAKTRERYRDYQHLVCFARQRLGKAMPRYLAKNNNHVMRLDDVLLTTEMQALVVFREPLQAAASLFRLHQRFIQQHQQQTFDRDYMAWLAHREFGLDHQAFTSCRPKDFLPDQANYWLHYWILVHERLLSNFPAQAKWVSHDAICQAPRKYLNTISTFLSLADVPEAAVQRYHERKESVSLDFQPELVARAQQVFQRLQQHPAHLTGSIT